MCMNDLSPYMWLNLKQFNQLTVTLVLWDSSTGCSLQIRNLKALKARLVKQQTILQPELFNSFMKWGAIAGWFVVLKPATREPLYLQQNTWRTFRFRGLQKLETGKTQGQGQDQWGERYGIISFPEILHLLCAAQLGKGSFAGVVAVPFILKWTFQCALQAVS